MAAPEKARAVNKVVINDKTVVDMTEDTAVAADVVSGKFFHSRSGAQLAGTMPNKGAAAIELSDLNAKAIVAGYYSGGTAKIADAEAAKVIPGNIKKGVTLFGVEGTLQDGPYNIASTDNADGSQNLAITDANGATLEMTEFTITSSVYSRLQAAIVLIYYDANGIHMVPGPITLPYTFTAARNSIFKLTLSPESGMPRAQNVVGCFAELDLSDYYIAPIAAVASIDLYNSD